MAMRRDFRPKAGGGKRGSTGPPAYFLPEDLYNSFEVKPGIPFWRTRNLNKTMKSHLGGLGKFLEQKFHQSAQFTIPEKLETVEEKDNRIVKRRWELRELRKERARAEYAMKTQRKLLGWDPHTPKDGRTTDGYLTLFVARLHPKTTEADLKEFMKSSSAGEVVTVRLVRDLKNPKKCYGFVEFSDEKSLQKAYHATDGGLLNGQNIVTDVERGRTVRAWVPRRFGGGLGGPPRQKGYTVKKGRGAPEPPVVSSRKRRAPDRPYYNERPPHPRMQQ